MACLPSTEETDELMLGYALEGIRLAGTFGSYREVAEEDVIVEDDGRKVPVKPGDRVFVSFVSFPFPLNCSCGCLDLYLCLAGLNPVILPGEDTS